MPVVATAAGAARGAKQQQRKRLRRVESAASNKHRNGSLDKWKASDPTFDYDGEIAKFEATRVDPVQTPIRPR